MNAITPKDSYRLFVETMQLEGYEFERQVDDQKRLVGYYWAGKSTHPPTLPTLSAYFHFVRRQSWLQISLHFHLKNVSFDTGEEIKTINVFHYSGNFFQEFQEDHPKTPEGVRNASLQVKVLLDRFQRDCEALKNKPHWNAETLILGKPLSNWMEFPLRGLIAAASESGTPTV